MTGKSRFLAEDATRAWLAQFDPVDQPAAIQLLGALRLVSRDGFFEGLRSLILEKSEGEGPIGLYAERELKHRKGIPHKLFRESRNKVRRAEGSGPQPVKPTKAYDPSVGSEGIVAQLITELCRQFPKKFLNHPGPDKIRKKRMRRFMVVTDFIGSGDRAFSYIQAAWLVRSVRSWWSARSVAGFKFEVVAYAATERGLARLQAHSSRPEAHFLHTCRTLTDAADRHRWSMVRDLCARYDPVDRDPSGSLGYGGIGALIVFSHGAPNNVPRLLHAANPKWAPLFPKRITAGTREGFADAQEPDARTINARLLEMRQVRLAGVPWLANAKPHVRNVLLVLASLNRSPRDTFAIARRTELSVLDVENAVAKALASDWITDGRRLTDRGRAELNRIRKDSSPSQPLSEEPEIPYYPTALRAPSKVSS